jgi:hypothetical protein
MLEIKSYPFYSKTVLPTGDVFSYNKMEKPGQWGWSIRLEDHITGIPVIEANIVGNMVRDNCIAIDQKEFSEALKQVKKQISKIRA